MTSRPINVGWMKQVAQTKKKALESELHHVALLYAQAFKKLIRTVYGNRSPFLPEKIAESFMAGVIKACQEDLRHGLDQALFVQREIIHLVYGDPKEMASISQRAHAVPYWNPTAQKVNISPMGLVKHVDEKTREAVFHDFVEPGEHIMIPDAYTVGGKFSTVYGVAPQLRPLPRQVDNSLDISPVTYTEWCTYRDWQLTSCCKKQQVWYDKKSCLICSKCGKPS